jgi:intracellular multiplication protein IcmD
MRIVTALLVALLALESCGSTAIPPSSLSLPSLILEGAPNGIDAFTVATPNGLLNLAPIVPLFELPQIPTNQGQLGLTMWGTKDANGNITALTQAQVFGMNGGQGSVHIFFDGSYNPVLFVDDASGYSILVSGVTSSTPTITLCDPDGTADASTVLTTVGGVLQVGPVQASSGSCAFAEALATQRRSSLDTGGAAQTVVANLGDLAPLIRAASYVTGFGFAIAAITKFKQHKDNPTQVPVGTPIVLIFIAASLIFTPAVFSTAGGTIFGTDTVPSANGSTPFYATPP